MIFEQIIDFFADPVNWTGAEGIISRTLEHVGYTLVSVLIALIIALPLGTLIGHTGKNSWLVIGFANASRALPTLGLLTLMVLLLGLGLMPATIVLVVLGIPPILTSSFAGVRGVDPAVVDAARGMGMPEWKIMLQVELPIATPVILGGLRSSMLQVIATATVAAYIALGGLGRFLLDGLALRDYGEMAAGAILVALLALLVDAIFATITKILDWRRNIKAATPIHLDFTDPETTETKLFRMTQ